MALTKDMLDVGNGVFAVDTHYVRPLMDASHLIVDGGRAAFVDTGTSHSVPRLMEALDAREVAPEDVDFVFLTHVHLDHAGGAGVLMQKLPNATAVLHPKGAPHMVFPERLIAGSKAVYGEALYRQLYGDIKAIPQKRVRTVEDGDHITLGGRELEFIHTPGHALHHYCIVDTAHASVFSGDSFGISYRDTDSAKGPFIFPTTTPTQFDPDAAHATIDRILGYAPERVYLTHYSAVTGIPALADDLHRRLDAYVDIAKRLIDSDQRPAMLRQALGEYLHNELIEHGFEGDEGARRAVIDPDIELNAQGLDVWLHRMRKLGNL